MGIITLITYSTLNNKEPLTEWLIALDATSKAVVIKRVERLEKGNFGDCEPVGDGVFELRIHYGPGFRVYFGKQGQTAVILLMGGDKGTQNRDIEKSKQYWLDYKERAHDKNKRNAKKKI